MGKAATVFTEQVWFRKNASGRQYLPHQLLADLGKDELAATEVRLWPPFQTLSASSPPPSLSH